MVGGGGWKGVHSDGEPLPVSTKAATVLLPATLILYFFKLFQAVVIVSKVSAFFRLLIGLSSPQLFLKATRIDWLSFLSPVFSQSWSSPFFISLRDSFWLVLGGYRYGEDDLYRRLRTQLRCFKIRTRALIVCRPIFFRPHPLSNTVISPTNIDS